MAADPIYRKDQSGHRFVYPEGEIVVAAVPPDKLSRLPVDILAPEGGFLGRDMLNLRADTDRQRLANQAGSRDGVSAGEWADRLLAVSGRLEPPIPEGAGQKTLGAALPRVPAVTLQREALSGDYPSIERLSFLDVLDSSPFIAGWSHLLSGYPKVGKTELMVRLTWEWAKAGYRVLYFTEESQMVWRPRLARQSSFDGLDVNIVFALGSERQAIEDTILSGPESVVCIDTTKLLRIRDENDNAAINIALTPLLAACRAQEKTLVLGHHTRKGGGEYGEAAAGGHAYAGIVDVVLQLDRDKHSDRRRLLSGWGRVVTVAEATYEMQDDGSLQFLGDPRALEAGEVKERVREALGPDWAITKEVHESLDDPPPSLEAVRVALNVLAQASVIERDPPFSAGGKRGKTHRWRIPPSVVPTKNP